MSILHIYLIKYLFLTQYPTTINDQTKKKESSGNHQPNLHHQPIYQNLKTTNQNHQNHRSKPSKPTNQNHQNHLSKPSKPTNQNLKTIKQRKKIATAIGESRGKWGDQQWHSCGETWESSRDKWRNREREVRVRPERKKKKKKSEVERGKNSKIWDAKLQ